MSTSPQAKRILNRMAQIKLMERGKICRMPGRSHYNHQTWQNGRNVVRYVPLEQIEVLQKAIEGYRLFLQLAQDYADILIAQTRRDLAKTFPRTDRRKAPKKNPRKAFKPP